MKYEYEHKRAKLFLERKTMVHAATSKFFVNGLVLECSDKLFVIKDRKDGAEKFIYYNELTKPLEPFKEITK